MRKVRLAINHAIDRDGLQQGDHGRPGRAAPGWPCRRRTGLTIRQAANFWPYDPDKAKKLLAEAGHPNGIEITFLG